MKLTRSWLENYIDIPFSTDELCHHLTMAGLEVDEILSIDEDSTQIETIKALHSLNKDKVKLAFANGGDQNNKSIPEAKICKELGIELIEGLGDKIQSSSWLLKK